MEHELRFGLFLGRLAILEKKLGPIMSNSFFMFSWANEFIIFLNIVASALESCIKRR